ncbi:mpv17-like protein [Saccoglossus kowalevskii]
MQAVRRAAKSHLLRNALFVGTTYAVSEFTQQTIIADSYDFPRIIRFGIWGGCFNGPFNYRWYKFLDAILPGAAVKTVVTKVFLEKFTATPTILYSFYVVMSILERKDDIFTEANQKIIPTYLASWGFWAPAQAINFYLVPPVYRVVYVGTVAFIWANFLCFMKRQAIVPGPVVSLHHQEDSTR